LEGIDDRVGKVRAGEPTRDAGQVWPEDSAFASRCHATTVAGVALDQFINLRAPNRVSSSGIFAQDELTNLFVGFFRDGRSKTRLELFLEAMLVPIFPEINSGSPRRIVRATVRVRVRCEARRLGLAQDDEHFLHGVEQVPAFAQTAQQQIGQVLVKIGLEAGQGVRAGAHDIRIKVAKSVESSREVGGFDRLCRQTLQECASEVWLGALLIFCSQKRAESRALHFFQRANDL
jgi:hypothetical protein